MSYLNRSGTTLNAIDYVSTLANSNKILERTNTGRNDIAWNNPPSSIPSGLNATPSQVLSGYKFVGSAGSLQTGTMPTQGGSTITPGTSNKTAVSAGRYVSGNIVVTGDADLVASNIRNGKNIFGVTGNVKEYKLWSGNLTTGSRTRYTDVNTNVSFYAYPLTFPSTGFTIEFAYCNMEYNPRIITMTMSWGKNYVIMYYGDYHELRFNTSYLVVWSSGTYNVWLLGYA